MSFVSRVAGAERDCRELIEEDSFMKVTEDMNSLNLLMGVKLQS